MADAIHSPTLVAFPVERVTGDLGDIAEAVRGYCPEQWDAVSVDHYVAVRGLVDAGNGLEEELGRVLATLPRR